MARDEAERPVEFDTWIAGRSAALTRFAYLLTGSEVAAERAMASALTVACASWSRVRRSDDPEAQVQRLVVQAHLSRGGPLRRRRRSLSAVPAAAPIRYPPGADDAARAWLLCATLTPEQRASVVLRCYAEMTYPQIAVMLDAKESVAEADVDLCFDRLGVAIGEERTKADLEAAFRDTFDEHAEDPADSVDRAALAYAGASQRRRRQIVSGVAAAALLVGGVTGVAAISYDGGGHPAAQKPLPGAHPQGWRAESYHGIQLWVPSSWGWGEVPRQTAQGLVTCGFTAYSPTAVALDLRYLVKGGPYPPYVGRPLTPDQTCPQHWSTSVQHVWFDSPLRVGKSPEQTTVRVAGRSGFNITIADPNRIERRTILASVEHVNVDAHGCPRDAAGLRQVESAARPEPSPRFVRTLSLCLFAGEAGHASLFYSTQVVGPSARQAAASIELAPGPNVTHVCLVTPSLNQVVLIARTAAQPSVFVVNPGICPNEPVGYVTGSGFHLLTEESLSLWAIDGLSLYASPTLQDDRLSPFLRTP